MEKSLTIQTQQEIAVQYGYKQNQIELMTQTIAKGATEDELKFFLQVCSHTGLDPFTRQIYMIKRNNKVKQDDGSWKTESSMTIQMGIDGFRAQAQATGEYSGSDDPEYGDMVESTYKDYNKKDIPFKHPEWARVSVWGKGDSRPTVSTVYWEEFYPGDLQGGQWRKMPRQMLSKVAEAQALRKRFPKALSNVYATEEMDQANSQDSSVVSDTQEKQEPVQLNAQGEPSITANMVKIIRQRAAEKNYDSGDVDKIVELKFKDKGYTSIKDMSRSEAEAMLEGINKAPAKGEKKDAATPEINTLEGEVMADKVDVKVGDNSTAYKESVEQEAKEKIEQFRNSQESK